MFSEGNSTKDISDAGADTAIVSVGATEQCGPNLPLNLDTLVAGYYARAWGEALGAYVLSTLPFNTSEEHSSFAGTVSLGPATVMAVLEEVVAGLRALALFLAPGSVSEGPYGTEVPERLGQFADYVGWERLAHDGSWGRYDPETDAEVATAEAGRALLEAFVSRQGERLKEHLAGACRLKGIA